MTLKLSVWEIIVRSMKDGWSQVTWCQDMTGLYIMCIFSLHNSPLALLGTFAGLSVWAVFTVKEASQVNQEGILHPSLVGDEQDDSGLFSCSLLTHHAFYSRNPSGEAGSSSLPRDQTKGKMEMGGNNMPALFSRAEDWLFKNSLGISAESVPEQIFFFLFFWIPLAFSSSKYPLPRDRLFATFQEKVKNSHDGVTNIAILTVALDNHSSCN